MAGRENLFVSWNECDTDAESLQVVNLVAGVPSLSKESQSVFVKSKIDGSIYSLSANMAQTPIFVDQGAWSNTQPYQFGNIAEYDGYRWICKQDHTGQQPVDFGDYWARIDTISQADVDNKLDKVDTADQGVASAVAFDKGIQLEVGYFGPGSPQLFFGTATNSYIHRQPNGDLVLVNQPGSGNNGGLGIRTVPATSKVETDVAAGNNNLTITEGDATTPAVMRFELFDEGGGKEYFFDTVDTNNSPTKIYGRDSSNKLVEIDPTFISSVAWGDITGNIANQTDVNLQNVTNNGNSTTNALVTGDLTVTTQAVGGESLKLPDGSWIRPLNSNTALFMTNGVDPDPTKYSTLHLDGSSTLYAGDGTVIRSEIKANQSGRVFLASNDATGVTGASIQLDPNDIQIETQVGTQILGNSTDLTLTGPGTQSLELAGSQTTFSGITTGVPIQDPVESYYYFETPTGQMQKTTFGVFKNLVQASDQSQTNFIAMSFTGGSGGNGRIVSSDELTIESFGELNIFPAQLTPNDGDVLVYRTTANGLVYEPKGSGTTPDLQAVTTAGATTNVVTEFLTRLLVGGATDDGVNTLQVDSSMRVGDTTDTTDNFINIYSLFDQSTGIKYREWDVANSFGFDTYYDGTTNKFNFDAVESNVVTGTAMSIDRGTRVVSVNERLLVGGATDNSTDAVQVDGSYFGTNGVKIENPSDAIDAGFYHTDGATNSRYLAMSNAAAGSRIVAGILGNIGTANSLRIFAANAAGTETLSATAFDDRFEVDQNLVVNDRVLIGNTTDDLTNDLQVDSSVRVGDTTDTSANFVNIYSGNAQSMGVQYREWNGANSFGFNNYYDGSTNTFNFDAVESNVVTGNVMRLSRSSRRLIIENSIEVPKFDNVPTGSIAYNYGEDSSGNLVKSGQVLSFTNPATLTPDASTTKQVNANAQAQALTINVPTNPTDGAKVIYRIRATATSALTWSASFVDLRGTLPTSAPINKTIYVGAIYNAFTSSWEIVSVVEQA